MKIIVNLSGISILLNVLTLAGVASVAHQQHKQRKLILSTNETLSTTLGAINTNQGDIKKLVTNVVGSLGNIAGDITGLKTINAQLVEALAAETVSPETLALAANALANSEDIETALTDLAQSAQSAADILPDTPTEEPTAETPTDGGETGETPETPSDATDPTDPTDTTDTTGTTEPAPATEEPAS